VRIAQKDQKSIRINPTQRRSLARDLRGPPLRSFARPKLLEPASVYAGVQAYPLFTMSRKPHAIARGGKDVLSMDVIWWSQPGSNRRPQACKASALPTELWPRSGRRISAGSNPPAQHEDVVGLGRFELPTSRLSSARSNQLSYRPEVRASMRRKRNVGGGVPLVISKQKARAGARAIRIVQVRARTPE
jgi:hypothetical protein